MLPRRVFWGEAEGPSLFRLRPLILHDGLPLTRFFWGDGRKSRANQVGPSGERLRYRG